MTSSGATSTGMPSGPSGALSTGFWYMLGIRMVWLIVGLLCRREHLSPWRQALLMDGNSVTATAEQVSSGGSLLALLSLVPPQATAAAAKGAET